MRSIAETPTVVRDIVDSAEERELWIVGREFERPPWFHAGKGGDTRLARALRVCLEDKITPNSDGSYTVAGSAGRTYRCDKSCSCPQSQKGPSIHCYHMVAVALYVEWRKRCAPAPVVLGTLRAGTAPLRSQVPATPLAEEQAEAWDLATRIDADTLGNGYPVDDETLAFSPVTVNERLAAATTACLTHALQEDRMPQDEYIPEPDDDDAPVAILEPPAATRALTPVAPQVDDLEAALQVWTTQRAVVQRFLKQELKPNIDYYTLKIGGKESKPSLSKAGAEKVMGWLKIQASFAPDTGTWEMLGRPQDLVCYVCTLRTRSGEIVGEGRGARSLKKDGGDVNKAIKMAEKSACVSAVLRTGALSDVFTCDLEDMQEPEPVKTASTTKRLTSQEMRQKIWTIVQQRAPEAKTREAVDDWVLKNTGLALHPDEYADILATLEGRGL